MSRLTTDDIDAFIAKAGKKSNDLLKAYKLARDPHEWNDEQNRIVKEHEAWLAEHGDDDDEDADDADHDRDHDDDEDDDADADADADADDRPKRGARTSGAARAPKRARASAPPAAAPVSETEPEKDAQPEEELDPATRKVREWRYKLQRAFLGKDGVAPASEMEAQDATFRIVEEHTDMTVEQLKLSKIGKVMKRIHQLPEVPRDDEFRFRERAGELVQKWAALLGAHADKA